MFKKFRVRFAPSPTGYMHLGNIRAALMNYLFARQNKGIFIVRIEDTDTNRNVSESLEQINTDLKWLGLSYDEGVSSGGSYGPYLQSERTEIYQEALLELITHQKAYRCFCTPETLECKREQQRAQNLPPRYDLTCLNLSSEKIKQKVEFGSPFIWRFHINTAQQLTINDMAKGQITFDMSNFGDFALTRSDGSVTFTFANFVDDWKMQISHVIRGQDHLSNTAFQAALYDAYALKAPTFWHLPIICNEKGAKMSKRDFGFALSDLKKAGYIPEAILNYLALIGSSTTKEVQSLKELTTNMNFTKIPSGGNIHYDVEKLTWLNHTWLSKLDVEQLTGRVAPLLHQAFPASKNLAPEKLTLLVKTLQPELRTLNDMVKLATFYFEEPMLDRQALDKKVGAEKVKTIIPFVAKHISNASGPNDLLKTLKAQAKEAGIGNKDLFVSLRYIFAGMFSGIGINDLFALFDLDALKTRFSRAK